MSQGTFTVSQKGNKKLDSLIMRRKTASFVMLEVASSVALIIPPPSHFSDPLFSHIFADNCWSDVTHFLNWNSLLLTTFSCHFLIGPVLNFYVWTYSHVPIYVTKLNMIDLSYMNIYQYTHAKQNITFTIHREQWKTYFQQNRFY